ncbi:MAG: hypothetical protein GC162_11115 [Planctomycetes bacterium]|nr:hypothetical protein [Planctomycetota bacterium]
MNIFDLYGIDPTIPVLVVGTLGGAIVSVVIFRRQRSRSRMVAYWARRRGLAFDAAQNQDLLDDCQFRILRRSRQSYAWNVCSGTFGPRPLIAMDVFSNNQRFSALIIRTPFDFKPLLVRPNESLDIVAELAGWEDIHFESAEFSRKYHVRADDRKWAYDVLHPRAIEFILKHAPYHVEFQGRSAAVHQNCEWRLEQFDEAVSYLNNLLNMLPNYVLEKAM